MFLSLQEGEFQKQNDCSEVNRLDSHRCCLAIPRKDSGRKLLSVQQQCACPLLVVGSSFFSCTNLKTLEDLNFNCHIRKFHFPSRSEISWPI